MSQKKKTILILVLMLLITIVIFRKVIITAFNCIIPSDVYTQVYPWVSEVINKIKNGELPLWSEKILGGYPIFADPQHEVFYIFQYIFLILGNSKFLLYAIQIFDISQYIIIGIFTYLCAKKYKISEADSIVAGIIFAYNGFSLSHIQHFCSMVTLKYFPIIMFLILDFYEADKIKLRYFLISIFTALMVFAGSIQIVLYNCTIILVLSLFRAIEKKSYKKFLYICMFFIIGVLISAIQLVPTAELSYDSGRESLTYYEFCNNSNYPRTLVTLLFPFMYDSTYIRNYLTPINSTFYMGLLPVIILLYYVISPKKEFKKLFVFSVFLYLLSLGRNTFLNKIVYMIPFFNKMQRSVNWYFYVQFCLAIIIGYTLDLIIKNKNKKCISLVAVSIFICIMITGYIILCSKNLIDFSNIQVIYNICLAFISIVIILLFCFKRISPKTFTFLIIFCLIIDILLVENNNDNLYEEVTFNYDIATYQSIYNDSFINDYIRNNNQNGDRVYYRNLENIGGITNENTFTGYNPLILKKYKEYCEKFEENSDYRLIETNNFDAKLLDLFSVRYVVNNKNESILIYDKNYELIYQNENVELYENKDYVPMYYFTNSIMYLEKEKIFSIITNFSYNPQEEIFSDTEIENKKYNVSENDSIEILVKKDNYIKLKVTNENEARLGTTEVMYNGWKVKINGEKGKIDTVNYIFRSVELEPGENIVEFYYMPSSLIIGAYISVVGIVIWVSLLIKYFYDKKNTKI
jgi:hypothetical protein